MVRMMTSERSRYGLFVSALGASVLAASVFMPWYGTGLAAAGQAAHHAPALSGEQALGGLAAALLVLAGLSLLDALFPIARSASVVPAGAGGAVVVLGVLAASMTLYRMVSPPAAAGGAALAVGAWAALLGSLTVALGGLWPRALPGIATAEAFGSDVWTTLGSWTP